MQGTLLAKPCGPSTQRSREHLHLVVPHRLYVTQQGPGGLEIAGFWKQPGVGVSSLPPSGGCFDSECRIAEKLQSS